MADLEQQGSSLTKRGNVRAPIQNLQTSVKSGWTTIRRGAPGQVLFWFVALALGLAAGLGAVGFRISIVELQRLIYGVHEVNRLHSFAEHLAWYWLVAIPVLGGLAVGVILQVFTSDKRVHAVADVIEGAALRDGRVETRTGIASVIASLITLSTGGSTGREGPVVHLASMISTAVANAMRADGITGRDLLGCAVAAAVSASFNAPIAGALFAMEVVLRHFSVRAFAPIVVASVAGTVASRLIFGEMTEFAIPGMSALRFYAELPAFMIMGLVCGIVAVILMRAVLFTDSFATSLQLRWNIPVWARPTIAGVLLGALAIPFPHIIGVGYETTNDALSGRLLLQDAFVFAILKVVAVAITMGGRMGGGIFSPALMTGALTGLTFGLIATHVFPSVSGSATLYALAGMGAVAAAVLGAPISTTLIVFELTGDWQTGIAVMVAVSLATALSARWVDKSFFLTQLERRNVHLSAGPQAYLLGMFRSRDVMRPLQDTTISEDTCWDMISAGAYIDAHATLERAMLLFEKSGHHFVPVVTLSDAESKPILAGVLYQLDALKAYNNALAAATAEEHR